MTIILIRHGAYNPKDIDPKEGLSEIGREKINTLLENLIKKGVKYDNVYCSPKTRAQQTADLLAKNIEIEETDLLKPNADPKALYEFIQTLSGNNLLVGHNPLLSYLSTYFAKSYQFETAGCLIIKDSETIIL
jgi:phosphohistidine phosphatase